MNITLHTAPDVVAPVVPCMQYDNANRTITATIENTDGSTVDGTAYLYAKKPDGNVIYTTDGVTFDSSTMTVSIVLSAQLTAAAGRANCVIAFLKTVSGTDTLLSICPFILEIVENPYNPEGVISTSVFEDAMQAAISEYVTENETAIFAKAGTTVGDMKTQLDQNTSDISINATAVAARVPLAQNNDSYKGINFDTTVSTGVYCRVEDTSGTTHPFKSTGILEVFKNNNYVLQRFTQMSDADTPSYVYIRGGNISGSWGEWKRIVVQSV